MPITNKREPNGFRWNSVAMFSKSRVRPTNTEQSPRETILMVEPCTVNDRTPEAGNDQWLPSCGRADDRTDGRRKELFGRRGGPENILLLVTRGYTGQSQYGRIGRTGENVGGRNLKKKIKVFFGTPPPPP